MTWKKGQSGNPKGRPKASKQRFLGRITAEARRIAKERGTTLERYIAEQMFVDQQVLVRYVDARIPKLKAVEVTGEIKGPQAQIVIDFGQAKEKKIAGRIVNDQCSNEQSQNTQPDKPLIDAGLRQIGKSSSG